MIYIKWVFFLVVNILTNYLINWPLAPIVVLFADEKGWLPWWLWYFQTPDNSLDGDEYAWKTKKPYPKTANKYQRWVNRFSWLHRNKLYGFSAAVLSVKYDRRDVHRVYNLPDYVYDVSLTGQSYQRFGNRWVNSVPSPGVNGTVKRFLYRDGKLIAWQIYYIRQWPKYPNKCIRLNLGWKLASWEDHNYEYASFAFSVSPWMTFAP